MRCVFAAAKGVHLGRDLKPANYVLYVQYTLLPGHFTAAINLEKAKSYVD